MKNRYKWCLICLLICIIQILCFLFCFNVKYEMDVRYIGRRVRESVNDLLKAAGNVNTFYGMDRLVKQVVDENPGGSVTLKIALIRQNDSVQEGSEVEIEIPNPDVVADETKDVLVDYVTRMLSHFVLNAGGSKVYLWTEGGENLFIGNVIEKIKGPDYKMSKGGSWLDALANKFEPIEWISGKPEEKLKEPEEFNPFRLIEKALDREIRKGLLEELSLGENHYVAAVDIGATNIKMAILDLKDGKIVEIREKRGKYGSDVSWKDFFRQIKEIYDEIKEKYSLAAVTFDVAGPVDMAYEKERVKGAPVIFSNYVFEEGQSGQDSLIESLTGWMGSLNIPVLTVNDALALMVGEQTAQISLDDGSIGDKSILYLLPGSGLAMDATGGGGNRMLHAAMEGPHASHFLNISEIKGRTIGNGEAQTAQHFFVRKLHEIFDGTFAISEEMEKESPLLFALLRDFSSITLSAFKKEVKNNSILKEFAEKIEEDKFDELKEKAIEVWKEYSRNLLTLALQIKDTQKLLDNEIEVLFFGSGGLLRGSSGVFVEKK